MRPPTVPVSPVRGPQGDFPEEEDNLCHVSGGRWPPRPWPWRRPAAGCLPPRLAPPRPTRPPWPGAHDDWLHRQFPRPRPPAASAPSSSAGIPATPTAAVTRPRPAPAHNHVHHFHSHSLPRTQRGACFPSQYRLHRQRAPDRHVGERDPPPGRPTVRRGSRNWLFGPHQLHCGVLSGPVAYRRVGVHKPSRRMGHHRRKQPNRQHQSNRHL